MKDAEINPFVDAQDSEHFESELVNNIAGRLRGEAERRKFGITFYVDEVRYSERGLIVFPVSVNGKLTTREQTTLMLLLEDAWNEQEPPPARRVHLADIGNPEISLRSTPPPVSQTV